MTIHKPSSWRPTLLAPLAFGACELAEVEIEPVPDLVVAAVSVVLTIDPVDPSRIDTRAFALLAVGGRQRYSREIEIPGASVTIVGESGRSLRLREVSDPLVTCVTPLDLEGRTRPPAGSCHVAAVPGAHFAPGERLSLTVELPDGGILRGESRMPGVFTPTGLSLRAGGCRLDPDTGYQFNWAHSAGSWAYLAEARLVGLGDLWPQESLLLEATLRRDDEPQLAFPRDLLFDIVDRWELARVLHEGLPAGSSAEIAVGALDRNWANWVRLGRIDLEGEVRIPSVFGDGTGMFGTAVRWKLEVESRAANPQAGDDDLPLCGPALES